MLKEGTVLQVNFPSFGVFVRATAVLALSAAAAWSADPSLIPKTVCEIARDLPASEGKTLAVLGRYSFRTNGRWIAEDVCDDGKPGAGLWMVEDLKDAPKPPDQLILDSAALKKKFAEIQTRTTLGNFKFGTADYDRWAVVYGRVEAAKGTEGKKSAGQLVFRGNAVIVVITPNEW
jgi:hypothetical protein